MRKLMFWTMAVVLLAAPVAARAGTTCAQALGNNSFDCTAVNEALVPYTICMTFTTPGAVGNLDITAAYPGSVYTGGCSCGAKGSATAPTFDVSSSFDCDASEGGDHIIFAGKASPGKIKKGHMTAYNGFSSLFSCVQRELACP